MDEPGVFFARVNSTLSAALFVLFGSRLSSGGLRRLLYVFLRHPMIQQLRAPLT